MLCIKLVTYWDKYTEMHGQQNVKICLIKLWHVLKDFYSHNPIETFALTIVCVYSFPSLQNMSWISPQVRSLIVQIRCKQKVCPRLPLCWEQRQVLPPPVGQFPAGNSPYLSSARIVRCPHGTLYIWLTPFQTFCRQDKRFLKCMNFSQWNKTPVQAQIYIMQSTIEREREREREAFASVRERDSCGIS